MLIALFEEPLKLIAYGHITDYGISVMWPCLFYADMLLPLIRTGSGRLHY